MDNEPSNVIHCGLFDGNNSRFLGEKDMESNKRNDVFFVLYIYAYLLFSKQIYLISTVYNMLKRHLRFSLNIFLLQ